MVRVFERRKRDTRSAEIGAEGADREVSGLNASACDGAEDAANASVGLSGAGSNQAPHVDVEMHHHHTHAPGAHHGSGHHLLQVEGLSVTFDGYEADKPFFKAEKRETKTLHDLSIAVHEGEIIAVVGASGSGKTLLADSIMGLFEPNARVSGSIWFDGKRVGARELASLRGRGISFVPQGVTSLDPMMRVGRQVEGFARGRDRAARRRRRSELFERYGLDPSVSKLYPHELSGGMARRVLLCCALMDDPRLIIADEPTPGLDIDLAVRALDDFRAFADGGGGVLLITHDIDLALRVADRVAVFKDGTVVEETAVANFADPKLLRHEFTKSLWHALPEHGMVARGEEAGSGLDDLEPADRCRDEHQGDGGPLSRCGESEGAHV